MWKKIESNKKTAMKVFKCKVTSNKRNTVCVCVCVCVCVTRARTCLLAQGWDCTRCSCFCFLSSWLTVSFISLRVRGGDGGCGCGPPLPGEEAEGGGREAGPRSGSVPAEWSRDSTAPFYCYKQDSTECLILKIITQTSLSSQNNILTPSFDVYSKHKWRNFD